MLRHWIAWGAISSFLCVAIGAFGAHALDLGEWAATYDTGVQYHMLHAVGMMIVGVAGDRLGRPAFTRWAGRLFAIGTVLFAGSLYVLSVTGVTWLGAITPLGGLAFLIGWALLALSAASAGQRS
ncbi:DUF423 domain-containing protein [Paenibacillus sp. TRM 82003]|nr:DUF423 domain-containing protein [Paenibacillus sp. TRM 82003]